MMQKVTLILLGLMVSSCAALPRSSPTVGEVLASDAVADIRVIDIAPDTPSALSAANMDLPEWTIADGPERPTGLQPGDILHITVFEVGYALFSNGAGASEPPIAAGGSGHDFPPLRVPDDGSISLPFGGELDVAGKSGAEVARMYEARLAGKSQDAQVLVSVEAGPRRSVVVSGDVKEPGRVKLTEANERLLDVIALARGPSERPADTLVKLTRDGRSSMARLQEITSSSRANVRLTPGDMVELQRDIRSVTVLGAAKSVSEIAFDDAELTLSEALARSGGPSSERADPTGVFIFRQAASAEDGSAVPVIYRLNLLQPASYFAAQNFQMRQNDIMLVADARSNRLETFLGMVNSLAGPALTVDLLTR